MKTLITLLMAFACLAAVMQLKGTKGRFPLLITVLLILSFLISLFPPVQESGLMLFRIGIFLSLLLSLKLLRSDRRGGLLMLAIVLPVATGNLFRLMHWPHVTAVEWSHLFALPALAAVYRFPSLKLRNERPLLTILATEALIRLILLLAAG